MALVAGAQTVPGRVMGHAGAFISSGEGDAMSKVRALEDAGAIIVRHPSKFGEGMKEILAKRNSIVPLVSISIALLFAWPIEVHKSHPSCSQSKVKSKNGGYIQLLGGPVSNLGNLS